VTRLWRAAALVLAASALSSCVATQQDVVGLAQQADDLKFQVADLKKTTGSMQANQADLALQIKQLREDLSAYSETVKASQGDMGQLSAKLDALGAQISGKMTQLGASLTTAQQAQLKGMAEQRAQIDAEARETAATELFMTAKNRLEAKDFALAASSFEDYLKRYPGSSLGDVSLYDLGLAYYGLKQWEKSGRQFAVLLDHYPKSGQTPGARLYYARCLLQLGKNRDEAIAYLQSVKTDFPKSPEAADAASELKKLSKKSARAEKAAASASK
jgi:TolA-binding protein